MFLEVLDFVIDDLHAFCFEEVFHAVGTAKMMLTREQSLAVDHPVGRHIGQAVRGIHCPAYHAGAAFGAEVGTYETVGGHTPLGDELHHLVNVLKKLSLIALCHKDVYFAFTMSESSPLSLAHLDSPAGWLALEANENHLLRVTFLDAAPASPQMSTDNLVLREASLQLAAYFKGDLQHFDLPLAPEGTEFQQRVWSMLLDIPFGESRSYMDLSLALDNPGAIRAVGAANGRNPIGIIIPCHRVIGSDGSLTGYAGGLERKEWLLRHEGILKAPSQMSLF